ncbi:MAG: hypothetical protein ABR987_08365 [Terracidiphilus sp.]
MAWALPLVGAQGICRKRAKGAEKESQSNFYYPWDGGEFRAKTGWGNLGVDPLFRVQGLGTRDERSESLNLLHAAFGLQDFNAALEASIGGHDGIAVSKRYRTEQNIDGSAMDSVILAEIEQVGSLNVIGGCDFLVTKGFKQVLNFGELTCIPDSGQNLLANWADDGCAPVLNRFSQLRQHLLLVGADAGLILAPERQRPNAGVNDHFQRSSTSIRSSWRIFL